MTGADDRHSQTELTVSEGEETCRKNHLHDKKTIPTMTSNFIILVVLAVYVSFNFLGAYIFMTIEKKSVEGTQHWLPGTKKRFLSNHTCITYEQLEEFIQDLERAKLEGVATLRGNATVFPEVWTLHNAFVLAFTIASTIGYGSVTPITTGGQVFAMIYALLSIPFTGLLAAKMGIVMAYYIKKGTTRALGLVPKVKAASLFFTLLFGIILYIILPSILLTFVSNEEGWSYVNCLYCVVVTLTTIGFGDYVPDPSTQAGVGSSVFVLVWVVAGLAWFATIVQLIATQMSRQAKSLRRKVQVSSPPLFKRLASTHANNGNNSKYKPNGGKVGDLGKDNAAVLIKVSDKPEFNHYDSIDTIDAEFEMRASREDVVDGRSEDDENISGPGSLHAVIMAHMPEES